MPRANSKTVNRIRVVRESINDINYLFLKSRSSPIQVAPRLIHSVAEHLGPAVVQQSHEFELVVKPKRPVSHFGFQNELAEFVLCPAKTEFLFACEFNADRH